METPNQKWHKDWLFHLTPKQMVEAYAQAEVIADSFWKNTGEGEEIWDEIWVDDIAFDLNVWEDEYEGGMERTNPVHATLYPTYEDENGLRDTDFDSWCIRLFTINPKGRTARFYNLDKFNSEVK